MNLKLICQQDEMSYYNVREWHENSDFSSELECYEESDESNFNEGLFHKFRFKFKFDYCLTN